MYWICPQISSCVKKIHLVCKFNKLRKNHSFNTRHGIKFCDLSDKTVKSVQLAVSSYQFQKPDYKKKIVKV